MYFLVLCMLHFLVIARSSLVFDEANQQAQKNKYCSQVAGCSPGVHVMCMFGDQTLGPRCDSGQKLPFDDDEKRFILDIFNHLRRELSEGNETLPRAYGMRKLFWNDSLAEFAQAWANQCDSYKHDFCRASEEFPRAGQIVSVYRFDYPNWTIPGEDDRNNIPSLTKEKRRTAIDAFTQSIYKNHAVTNATIEKPSSGDFEFGNPYLTAIYGTSTYVGCGMTTYLEYHRQTDDKPLIYHAVETVCNFSSQPVDGEKIYETKWANGADWTECGCPQGFIEDDCLCVRGVRAKNRTEEDPPTPPSPPSPPPPHTTPTMITDDDDDCPNCSPHVVIMPIITVENADPKKIDLLNSQMTKEQQQRNRLLRQQIKDRVQTVRDRYFKDFAVLDPGTRFSNGGPLDEDTFVLSKSNPKLPYTNKKESTKIETNERRFNVEIKDRRDFSDLDELVSEYLLKLHNDDLNHNLNMTDGTVIDLKDTEDDKQDKNLQYDEHDFSNYWELLLSDLNNNEKLKNHAFTGKFNGIVNEKAKEIAHILNNIQSLNKQIQKGDSMDSTDLKDYAKEYHSNADYGERILGEQGISPRRSQNLLNTHEHDTKHFDYQLNAENDQSYRNIDPESMIVDDYNGYQNDEKPIEYSGGENGPYVYDANEIAHYYLDRLHEGTDFGHRLDTPVPGTRHRVDTGTNTGHRQSTSTVTGYRRERKRPYHLENKSSKFKHLRHNANYETDDHKHMERYFVPDRLNLEHGL